MSNGSDGSVTGKPFTKPAKARRRTGEKDRPDVETDDPRLHPKKTGIRGATLIQNIEQVCQRLSLSHVSPPFRIMFPEAIG